MERENGYYWVKDAGEWGILEYYEGKWYAPRIEYPFNESDDIDEIDENRITRDENRSGKEADKQA